MKCIKAVKNTEKIKIGYIKRVSDLEAIEKTSTGYWTFISKKEWKESLQKKDVEYLKTNLENSLQPLPEEVNTLTVKTATKKKNVKNKS